MSFLLENFFLKIEETKGGLHIRIHEYSQVSQQSHSHENM